MSIEIEKFYSSLRNPLFDLTICLYADCCSSFVPCENKRKIDFMSFFFFMILFLTNNFFFGNEIGRPRFRLRINPMNSPCLAVPTKSNFSFDFFRFRKGIEIVGNTDLDLKNSGAMTQKVINALQVSSKRFILMRNESQEEKQTRILFSFLFLTMVRKGEPELHNKTKRRLKFGVFK